MIGDTGNSAAAALWERRLRFALGAVLLLSLAFAGQYVVTGLVDATEYPFVANSVAKDGFFAALCLIALADLRRFGFCVTLVAVGHVLLVLGMTVAIIGGGTSTVAHTLVDVPLPASSFVWVWMGVDALLAAALFFLYGRVLRARFGLRRITHLEYVTLAALAEILVDAPGADPSPEQVARNVDEYFVELPAAGALPLRVAVFALALFPLLYLRAPFPLMSAALRRRFVQRHLLDAGFERWRPGLLRDLPVAMARAAQQLCFIGYYGDPDGARSVGYEPYSARHDTPSPVPRAAPRPLGVRSAREVDGEELSADVVVVGSGAAGAMLAYRLAELGRDVLVLERGRHVDPSEFSERESTQISRLYADGAATLSRDLKFAVLQGQCVGGSTVVNNAVCFDLPDAVLDRWLDPSGLHAGLDADGLRAAFEAVRRFLPVRRMEPKVILNPGASHFVEGVRALGYDAAPWSFGVVDANISDECLGCGYCNIGCPHGFKLSMLDNVLPRAQADFGRERVRVLAECRAQAIEHENGRASAVRCRLGDGRTVRVRARTVVVAAGAMGSSLLLQASDLQRGRAGRGLSFNIGVPLTADFPDVVHSERGLQISHYLEPPGSPGYMLETWFNPVLMQSLFMPGWFHRHRENMLRYPYMTCVGAVAPSHSSASVRRGLLGGVDLSYEPTREELTRIVEGLKLAARICFEGGATRAMPPTLRYRELRPRDDIDSLDELIESGDLSLGSSHPQGGNPVSASRERGVVDPDFRVWGTDNVHVCDASVFPCAIGVNPQLTVMALAEYAAPRIAGTPRRREEAARRREAPAAPASRSGRVLTRTA